MFTKDYFSKEFEKTWEKSKKKIEKFGKLGEKMKKFGERNGKLKKSVFSKERWNINSKLPN